MVSSQNKYSQSESPLFNVFDSHKVPLVLTKIPLVTNALVRDLESLTWIYGKQYR
jgi:hypothetical protein